MQNYDSPDGSGKPARRVRRKYEEGKSLSITSLLDVLTIILVFLIKNVSTESARISAEAGLNYPSSITNDKLLEKSGATPVKIFPDKVLVGVDGLNFGNPKDLLENAQKRIDISKYLQLEANDIFKTEGHEACLVVQADSAIPCGYVTEIVRIGTDAGFTYIYFATLADPDWLKNTSLSSTQ
ncbi:MAG: biopolymer transporter ExbD [Candidatus Cloacimonas sp.]|jgi:biopolymer transport protein ExbD|nr:biopolymer transporter ExbD [Candidatus Cloacimonas sp.]